MIKNLKSKFLICLFLLVAVFSVTSSCFAVSYNFNSVLFYDGYNYLKENGYSVSLSKNWVLSYSNDGSYTLVFFNATVGNVTIMDNKHCYYFNSAGSGMVYPSRTVLKYVDGAYTVTTPSSSADLNIVSSNIISSMNIYKYTSNSALGSLLCNAYDLPENSDNNITGDSSSNYPFSIESLYNSSSFINANEALGRGFDSSNSNVLIFTDSGLSGFYYIVVLSNEIAYVKSNDTNTYFDYYDEDNNIITDINSTIIGSYSSSGLNFYTDSASYQMYGAGMRGNVSEVKDLTTIKVLNSDGSVFFNPVTDTSFNYTLFGVKRGQVKLNINNLDSSLRMYGYVGLNTTFTIGDTLDVTANINSLRLISTRSDNSDLYCYVSEGEEVNYYIVDENNVVLDTGYISEMAKGYFLYGFEVNNGVDFVFLKDGQVYWDNNLTFKYNANNSNIIENNDIVSIGQYSYIETNKTVSNGTYTGFVYDSSDNLLVQADCDYSNDLSSLSVKVETSYYEVETLLKHYSCYWLQTIYLTGNNSDGTSIDFSNYYINWSVPAWVDFDKIELGAEEYNKRSGTLTGFTSTGVLSMFNLKLYEYLNVHTKSFDITLQVYDGNGTLVLTHIINSDDIVSEQIKSEENNVDKGDYGILDNPGYTGGSDSNYGDIGNIQNWTADDYINLMSTDNFVWEFFKAILGNLPWWITTPLTILIFGVVIITIIRFARGA